MNLLKAVTLLALLSIALYQPASSQIKFSIGPSAGLTVPAGDYSGTTVDYYYGSKYGLSSGLNVGAVAKISFPILRLRAAANFSFLSNTGNAEPDKPNSFIELKHTVFVLSVGPEFAFGIPASPVKPYVGADLLITTFNGETKFNGVDEVPSGSHDLSSATRTGIGVGAGAEVSFGKKITLDVGLRYNFHNLLGKSFDAYSSSDRINSYIHLNDDKDPNYEGFNSKHPIGSSRSISTFQVNVAILFNL